MTAKTINILFGPPSDPNDCKKMLSGFFSENGKHIVCGGTTAAIVSDHLKKPLKVSLEYIDPSVPPVGEIEGVDLVTEGIVTMKKVQEYVKHYIEDKTGQDRSDGASLIFRFLMEADNINIYAGHAVNPNHQDTAFSIDINSKIKLLDTLADDLRKLQKNVEIFCF